MSRPYDLQPRHLAMPIKNVKQSRSFEFDRVWLLVLILLGAVGVACSSPREELRGNADMATLRSPAAGPVVGFNTEGGAHAWLGIPFAKPPVGDLRWRVPQPAAPWAEAREVLSYGASCVQFAGPGGGRNGEDEGEATGSEDCLFLNVFAPRFAVDAVPGADESLPVMFWIHGGGNTIGDATVYDASRLAVQENVVVVSVHYRMGVLGWFSHPSLRTPGTSGVDGSGNYGTLDLVRGLEWVKKNIGAFGGDPDRVTVFGESAGGRNVFSLLLARPAAGLFHGAIAQSGSANTVPRSDAENFVDDAEPGYFASSNEAIAKMLIADGRAENRDEAKAYMSQMSHVQTAEYLRSLSPAQLLTGYDGAQFGGMYSIKQLVRDGVVIPKEPAVEAMKLGKYNQVPTIMGTNRHELRLFVMFSSEHIGHFFGLPMWIKDVDRFQASTDIPTKLWKIRGVDAPAAAMREVQGPSVYGYRFDWDEEPKVGFIDMSQSLGAAHAMEIPFVFGWLSLGPATRFVFDEDKADSNRVLSNQMMSYWSQFAYSGNPGRGRSGDLPLWSSWSDASQSEGDTFIVFDSQDGGGVRMSKQAPLVIDEVLAEIAADPRIAGHVHDRCEIYYSIATRSTDMSEADYDAIEDGLCATEYPLAEYPW
jgi:para-nitrobenzyl esterase